MRAWILTYLLAALALAGCAEDAGPTEQADDATSLDDELEATDSTGVIRGVVLDRAVVPIVAATVTVLGQDLTTETNEVGEFGLDGLEPGTYFLEVSKLGYNRTQQNADVVAGVELPPIVKVVLESNPTTMPFFEANQIKGYLACGAPVFVTSLGCTTMPQLADATDSKGIFPQDWEMLPQHIQGELYWENTQVLGGQFIWELSPSEWPDAPQPAWGYRDVTPSPALAYMNQTHIEGEADGEDVSDWMMSRGMNYRIFAGPSELCDVDGTFGCGLTLDQGMEAYLHSFYNFSPEEGWRYIANGDPKVPQ